MSKYYEPDIGEFHVGFEYEVYVYEHPITGHGMFRGRKNSNKHWDKRTVTAEPFKTHCLSSYQDERVSYHLKNENLRVKHLDQEDVESLGFSFKGKSHRSFFDMECDFDLPDTDSFKCTKLKIQLDEKYRTVKIEGEINKGSDPEVFFSGRCKNKSELIKNLKQAGNE